MNIDRFIPTWAIYDHARRVGILVLIVCACAVSWRLYQTVGQVRIAATELAGASGEMRAFLDAQTKELQSERSKKLIENNLAVGSAAIGTIRLLNTQIVPEIRTTLRTSQRSLQSLDSLIAATERDLSATLRSSNALVANLDRRVTADDGLIRELQSTVAALRQPVETVTPQLVALVESGRLAIDDVRTTLAGDEMKRIVSEMGRASIGLADTTAEAARGTKALADTAEKFPLLAEQLNKFATTTNKYSKALILARIISMLGGVFCC